MKLLRSVLWVLFLALTGMQLSASVPNKEFSTITLEEAQELANAAKTGAQGHELANLALESRRLDLVALYFKSGYTMAFILDEVTALPDSPYKDKLVVTMLKTPSAFWPREEGLPFGSRGANSIRMQPFRSVIGKLLPGKAVSEEAGQTKAARLKLAEDLEKAMIARSTEQPPLDVQPSVPTAPASTPMPSTPKETSATPEAPDADSPSSASDLEITLTPPSEPITDLHTALQLEITNRSPNLLRVIIPTEQAIKGVSAPKNWVMKAKPAPKPEKVLFTTIHAVGLPKGRSLTAPIYLDSYVVQAGNGHARLEFEVWGGIIGGGNPVTKQVDCNVDVEIANSISQTPQPAVSPNVSQPQNKRPDRKLAFVVGGGIVGACGLMILRLRRRNSEGKP